MIALEFRRILQEVGCWPPKCHICLKMINGDEEISFVASKTKDVASGRALLAGCHVACKTSGEPAEEPATAARGNGCFLTESDILTGYEAIS